MPRLQSSLRTLGKNGVIHNNSNMMPGVSFPSKQKMAHQNDQSKSMKTIDVTGGILRCKIMPDLEDSLVPCRYVIERNIIDR